MQHASHRCMGYDRTYHEVVELELRLQCHGHRQPGHAATMSTSQKTLSSGTYPAPTITTRGDCPSSFMSLSTVPTGSSSEAVPRFYKTPARSKRYRTFWGYILGVYKCITCKILCLPTTNSNVHNIIYMIIQLLKCDPFVQTFKCNVLIGGYLP